MAVGLQQFFLSAEEDLFYDLYSASFILSTPLVRCTHMCFHRACWRKFLYPGDWGIYYCTLLLHVNTSCVSSNIYWQSLVRACEVAHILVQLLTGECGCCGCLFVLLLLFGLSTSESEVAASFACWSVSGGGYWIHLWQHWILGLVGWLAQWLGLDLVLGCILAPGVGK